LATGWGHSLIGTDSKHVYGFGLNQSGQLGLGHSSHKGHGNTMTLASDQALKAVSCGREHSHILVQQGEQSKYNCIMQVGFYDLYIYIYSQAVTFIRLETICMDN
jgi:alpha-tubulin suppressor-like RCC1 family protein